MFCGPKLIRRETMQNCYCTGLNYQCIYNLDVSHGNGNRRICYELLLILPSHSLVVFRGKLLTWVHALSWNFGRFVLTTPAHFAQIYLVCRQSYKYFLGHEIFFRNDVLLPGLTLDSARSNTHTLFIFKEIRTLLFCS
jgi:hypothetical protein